MSDHKPKGYAFGGLIKKAGQRAVRELKDWAPTWRARPPAAPTSRVGGALADMERRQAKAQEIAEQKRGWKYKDRRQKVWDDTKMWLDREAGPDASAGHREVLKHEIPDLDLTTRWGALSTLRKQNMGPITFSELADTVLANPGGYHPEEVAMVRQTAEGLRRSPLAINRSKPMDDVAYHPLLKEAYPELWDRTYVGQYHPDSASGMAGNLGEFHSPLFENSKASIQLLAPGGTRYNTMTGGSPLATPDSVLLHEYQHNLQDNFGWQGGASPSIYEIDPWTENSVPESQIMENYFRTKGEADARLAQLRRELALRDGVSVLDTPPWEMYSMPSVGVDENDLILDTSPWENYLKQRYGSEY